MFGADIQYHGIGSYVNRGEAVAPLEDMTPHSQEDRITRWSVYIIGTAVFMAILYFCLCRFFDASIKVSLGVAVPAGLVGFWIFAKILENMDTPPGFWDNSGG